MNESKEKTRVLRQGLTNLQGSLAKDVAGAAALKDSLSARLLTVNQLMKVPDDTAPKLSASLQATPAAVLTHGAPPPIQTQQNAGAASSSSAGPSTPQKGVAGAKEKQRSAPIVEPELAIAQAPPPKARGRPPKGSTAFVPTPDDAEKWIRPASEFRQIAVVLKEAMRQKFGTGAEYESRYRQLNVNRQHTIYAPAKKINMWVADSATLPALCL